MAFPGLANWNRMPMRTGDLRRTWILQPNIFFIMMIVSCLGKCAALFCLMSRKSDPVDRTLHYILIQDICSIFVWKIRMLAVGFVLHNHGYSSSDCRFKFAWDRLRLDYLRTIGSLAFPLTHAWKWNWRKCQSIMIPLIRPKILNPAFRVLNLQKMHQNLSEFNFNMKRVEWFF